jgi:glycolate oxidase iron-sulfur subunit
MSAIPPARAATLELLNLADQCVLCGLCLPACPTYRVGRTEAESPRGRITLAKALAAGEMAAQPSALAHLDHCLGCLSCERVCPSGVQYGRLIDLSRREAARPPDRLQRLIYALIARPRWIRVLARLGEALRLPRWLEAIASRSGHASRFARWIGRLPRLPVLQGSPVPVTSAPGERGRIGLFLGCVASAFDRDTHAAVRHLLAALGYAVIEPPGQGCCGALPRHTGHESVAQPLAATTRQAFVEAGVDTVLVSASGCYGDMRDVVLADTGIAVREIGEFLATDPQFATLTFRPLPLKAALHRPCSLDNTVRAAAATRSLLTHIPQLQIADLPEQPGCCGAGGSHFLRYPAIADPLRDERLDQVQAQQADLLLTSNIGCRIHLGNGLRARGRVIEVLHPVTLLARQLKGGVDTPTPLLSRRGSAR